MFFFFDDVKGDVPPVGAERDVIDLARVGQQGRSAGVE
jgi:hypothetical protein